ncbi:hypothetical protein F4776DRAFT_646302 [Hypoxylon sp. NC0597]|nr:hypothetical protein F4776DRAFT_646302 [Hypoxylon sp. NC0597]
MSTPASYVGKLCCSICGDAILPQTSELSETTKWQAEAVLLSDPAREFEQLGEHYRGGKRRNAPRLKLEITQEVRKDRARVIQGDRLQIIIAEGDEESADSQEEVLANHSNGRDVNGEWASIPYYIVTHGGCLELAETVMRRSPHDIVVRDLRTLWKVLRMRFEVDDSYYMSSTTDSVERPQRIQLPHAYYMPFRPPLLAMGYAPGEQADQAAASDHKIERWEAAYPVHVPDATATILENLNTLPPAPATIPEATPFSKKFVALPPELQIHVCSFLTSRHGMPSVCNGLLPQWVWREILLGGRCLPFLRDLDINVAKDFCSRWDREHSHCEPNWELLVRKLSQEAWGIYDAEKSMLKVPNGLRNRRRIWKLVEEMYVGDLVPIAQASYLGIEPVRVPRYWNEGGEQVYPVVRDQAGSKGKRRDTSQ